MRKEPKRFAMRELNGRQEVLIATDPNIDWPQVQTERWFACDSAEEAQLLADSAVLYFKCLQNNHRNHDYRKQLRETIWVLNKYRLGTLARYLTHYVEESDQIAHQEWR